MTTDTVVAEQAPAMLAARVAELESRPMSEFRILRGPVAEALETALRIGADELAQRAYLLQAGTSLREGRLGEGGQIAHRVRAWAEEHSNEYVLARAHRELSIFYRHVGDMADSLTHGVQCVQYLPDSTPPVIRARHLVTLAMALDDSGSTDEGDRRSREALAISTAIGDDELTLQILNNMAYTAFENDDEPAARDLAGRMREVGQRSGRRLAANELDTLARVAMMGGSYEQVEAALAGVFDDEQIGVYGGDAVAECLLTLAEARRLDGRYVEAQEALDIAVRQCDDRGLVRVRARVRQEQAALLAATGRYLEAYEEHRSFHAATTALHNTQRDARARALQAVFEAAEARRASDRFREMAHRDALTGLYNRRYVNERVPELLAESAGRRPLSLAIVDLDHFKRVNDTLSHATGDTVLQKIAELLEETATGAAVAARMGGEEFLLVFPGVDAAEAAARCDRLRGRIRSFGWAPITGTLAVTTSIGVTTAADGHGTLTGLLALADRNLYAAKRAGRDRVVADAA